MAGVAPGVAGNQAKNGIFLEVGSVSTDLLSNIFSGFFKFHVCIGVCERKVRT
jgi:hypothetical protein